MLELGHHSHYHTNPKPIARCDAPASFDAWAERHGLAHCNSVLVNVYPNASASASATAPGTTSYFGWHCDSTSNTMMELARGARGALVASISLAVDLQDRASGAPLAVMEFGRQRGAGDPHEIERAVELRHGTLVRFDARADESAGLQHRVPCTLRPRVNITFRMMHERLSRGRYIEDDSDW